MLHPNLSARHSITRDLQVTARLRLKINGQAAFIRKQCKQVMTKLRKRRTNTAPITPRVCKAQWALAVIEETAYVPKPARLPPWMKEDSDHLKQLEAYRISQREREKLVKKHFTQKWQTSWDVYQKKHDRDPTVAQTAQLSKKERLNLHASLAKAESSLAVQVRTEKIGFAQFLHRQRVPSAASPACDCGWHSQTAKHIIRHCRLRPFRQRMLERAGTTDYRTLITTSKGLKVVTEWLMKSGLLSQFSLANEQLYQ